MTRTTKIYLIVLIFMICSLSVSGQSADSLRFDFKNECEKNFSVEKTDSSYCNFYIKDFSDTIYFKHSACILEAQTTSPLTVKRRIQNGYATGFIRIYSQYNDSYSWIDGNYSDGFILNGSYLEYYLNGTLKLSGQFEKGQLNGVWTWYFENGIINRIIVYETAEPIRELEYDPEGILIDEYDFVKEKLMPTSK